MNMRNDGTNKNAKHSARWKACGLAASLLLATVSVAGCSDRSAAKTVNEKEQMTYATPDEAGQALEAAARANSDAALEQILGPAANRIFDLGDATANKNDRDLFVAKYGEMHRWVLMNNGSQVLTVGADNYPFPEPLEQVDHAKWQFNSEAGEDEVLVRRIGENELLAVDACSAIANAQNLYSRKPHGTNSTAEYTTKIISSPGKHDGLYWQVPEGHEASPLGRMETFAPSAITSAENGGPVVIDGYTFRVLTSQGPSAPGGARSYIQKGKFTGGYAVLASPVKYGETGIMTFLLGPGGFYERDLGNATAEIAASTKDFNPTAEWTQVD